MNLYKIGCNFDEKLIDTVVELNKKYEGRGKIVEMFGSDSEHAELAARPAWRLQSLTEEQFRSFVKKCNDNDIIFNYTLNSIQPYGSKQELVAHKGEVQDFIKFLIDAGVKRLTIANPMLMYIAREVTDISIEVSTIAHIDTVTQLKYFHESLGIDKFCCSILKNRNRDFLKHAADYCNKHGLILELLANEFCGVSGVDQETNLPYTTHCVYRDSCYLCHASCKTKEDSMSYNNYPMRYCMTARGKAQEGWLRLRWIRPEDQKLYNEIGINYFKLSGRTGTTEYLKMIMESYLSESFDGNLLELWKPLQTIYTGQKESDFEHKENIPNKLLDGFVKKNWFDQNFDCADQECGTTCTYCRDFYKSIENQLTNKKDD